MRLGGDTGQFPAPREDLPLVPPGSGGERGVRFVGWVAAPCWGSEETSHLVAVFSGRVLHVCHTGLRIVWGWVVGGCGVCVLVENCTVDASIFVVKLLRANGGCLGTRSR